MQATPLHRPVALEAASYIPVSNRLFAFSNRITADLQSLLDVTWADSQGLFGRWEVSSPLDGHSLDETNEKGIKKGALPITKNETRDFIGIHPDARALVANDVARLMVRLKIGGKGWLFCAISATKFKIDSNSIESFSIVEKISNQWHNL